MHASRHSPARQSNARRLELAELPFDGDAAGTLQRAHNDNMHQQPFQSSQLFRPKLGKLHVALIGRLKSDEATRTKCLICVPVRFRDAAKTTRTHQSPRITLTHHSHYV